MKKIFLICASTSLLALQLSAQAPRKFNYQGIARSTTGTALANQSLSIKISILDGSETGATTLYAETQKVTTNNSGLYNLAIGGGTAATGNMNEVDWSAGERYIKVEIDPKGGTAYADLGTTQLLSVPYALYAQSGTPGPQGDVGPQGPKGDKGETGAAGSITAAAGGDLTGTFPNPSIADNKITTSKIVDKAVTGNKLSNMSATVGQVLTFTGTTWAPSDAESPGWSLSGNIGTSENDFIGTDNTTFKVKIGSSRVGYISPNDNNTTWGKGAFQKMDVKKGPGDFNTAIGGAALGSTTRGSYNVGLGYAALLSNDGDNNVAVGSHALSDNGSGKYNIGIGSNSMMGNDEGGYNIAIGSETQIPGLNGNSSNSSIAIGNSGNASGQGSIAFGSKAKTAGNNSVAIGQDAQVLGNNIIHLGNTSITEISGQVPFSSYSDGRIKTNIQSDVPGLSFVTKLRPITYNLNIHAQNEHLGIASGDFPEKYAIEKIKQTGFIAQEVAQAANDVAFDFNGIVAPTNEKDLYKIRYAEFVVPIVKAIQEQQDLIQALTEQIEKLKSEIEVLKMK